MRTMTLFDESGDTSVAWDNEHDFEMKKIIEKKMKEGITFYIVKPRFGGLLGESKKKLTNVSQIRENKVTVHDKDMMKFFGVSGSGKMILNSTSDEEDTVEYVKQADSAEEVSQNHSVGVRPVRAG